jgi:hypothetical protein
LEELGATRGYGSFHISPETLGEIERLLAQHGNGRRVNSIFGEGVNPRFRKVREALSIAGLASDQLLQHGSPRLVYAVPLAHNFREVLVGREDDRRPILPQSSPARVSSAIAAFWRERWLSPRVQRPGVLEAVARHTLTCPVDHGARVKVPDGEEQLAIPGTVC